MGDWIGLGIIVLVVVGALVGLSYLGKRPKPITAEEYEKRVAEAKGAARGVAVAGLGALDKFVNPKAAQAIEVQQDLRAGYYDDQEEEGDDPNVTEDEHDSEPARGRADEPRETLKSVRERLHRQGKLNDSDLNKAEGEGDA